MQPAGRTVPNSVRALLADGDQRNEGWCGRRQDRLQLMRKSLGRHEEQQQQEGGGERRHARSPADPVGVVHSEDSFEPR
jgi:hypothetical protein